MVLRRTVGQFLTRLHHTAGRERERERERTQRSGPSSFFGITVMAKQIAPPGSLIHGCVCEGLLSFSLRHEERLPV